MYVDILSTYYADLAYLPGWQKFLALLGESSRRRFRLFKKPNICFITESAISLLPGDLIKNAMFGQLLN